MLSYFFSLAKECMNMEKKKKKQQKNLKNKHLESEYFRGINLKTSFFIAGVSFCAENIS